VTVTELPTLGNETWTMLSPVTQSMVVHKDGEKFVFKDEEQAPVTPTPVTPVPPVVPPTTPPTTPPFVPQPPSISLEQQNMEGLNTGDGVTEFTDVVDPTSAAYPNGDPVDVVASVTGTTTDGGTITQPVEVGRVLEADGKHEDIRYKFQYTAPNTVDVKVTQTVKVTDEAPGNGLSAVASTFFPITQPF
jgi:hypothetical protein